MWRVIAAILSAAAPIHGHVGDEALSLLATKFVDRERWPVERLQAKLRNMRWQCRGAESTLQALVKSLDENMVYLPTESGFSDFCHEVTERSGSSVSFTRSAISRRGLRGFQEIKLLDFTPTTQSDLSQGILRHFKHQGIPKGLILDLRGNGGGQVNAAVAVASLFLPPGSVVARVASGNANKQDVLVTPPLRRKPFANSAHHRLQNLPLVVVIDRETASAAELLAAALKDHQRALIASYDNTFVWGHLRQCRTYGKGTIQTPFALSDGSALLVTTHRFFSPLGCVVDGTGIVSNLNLRSL
jgi:hypothetical protein